MNIITAQNSASVGLHEHLVLYASVAAIALSGNAYESLGFSWQPSELPSEYRPERELSAIGLEARPTRFVTAEESRLLRDAILASSEVIDDGELI